jgi:monothiol glutaredoxin
MQGVDGMDAEIVQIIKDQIANSDIIIYMKGTPNEPACGFSARAVSCLKQCNAPFAFVDILANPEIRATLPQMANWPTFPQLYVKGELIGGCDIMVEMFQNGELKKLIESVVPSA